MRRIRGCDDYCSKLAGGEGHQIVAIIAEERLTPAAKDQIHELIDGADISQAVIANWADAIRRERRETTSWHYVDIPTTQPSYNAARDGHNGDNVIDAIERSEKVLADKSKPKEERAEALKYLVHFVGDLHQPCHTTERNGDRGANARLVFFLDQKKTVSLHAVWDTQILKRRKGGGKVLLAGDGHRAAIEYVYRDVPESGDPPKIDQAYVERAGPVVDEQLERAGVRLAMVLNRALGGK